MKTGLQFIAIAPLIFAGAAASAECGIWAVEDTSSGGQDRSRVFASSDLRERDALVAEAAGIALRQADANNLDFVDVFLTRPQDGTVREDHSSYTSTVWMRFNPGDTPIQDATWSGQALDDGADVEMTYGILDGSRSDLGEDEIEGIVAEAPEGVSQECRGA